MTSKYTERSAPPSAEADRPLVTRAQRGDQEAFRILVERYQGRAFRLAFRILRDEDQARDAVQESFLKVYRTLRRFEGRSSFYTWLYRLVLNVCLDLRRRDRSGRQVEWSEGRALEAKVKSSLSASLAGVTREEEAPDVALERAELRRRVAEAIAQLPEGARETLLLREVEGLSYAEIAEVLGIPKGTVMSRLHYARKRVQAILLEAEDPRGGAGVEAGASPAPGGGKRPEPDGVEV